MKETFNIEEFGKEYSYGDRLTLRKLILVQKAQGNDEELKRVTFNPMIHEPKPSKQATPGQTEGGDASLDDS